MRTIDPGQWISLQSLDLGSVYSPDGREHPVTGLTPVSFDVPDSTANVPVKTGETSVQTPGGTLTSPANWLSWLLPTPPQHIGTRLVIGIIAIGVILIVALRLSK